MTFWPCPLPPRDALGLGLAVAGLCACSGWELVLAQNLPPAAAQASEKASAAFAAGRAAEAAAIFQDLLRQFPTNAFLLANLAAIRFEQGDLDASHRLATSALDAAPDDAFSHRILGLSLLRLKRRDEALSLLTRAALLAPRDPAVRNDLGVLCTELGWWDVAEDQFRRALALDTAYQEAQDNLALLLKQARSLAHRSD